MLLIVLSGKPSLRPGKCRGCRGSGLYYFRGVPACSIRASSSLRSDWGSAPCNSSLRGNPYLAMGDISREADEQFAGERYDRDASSDGRATRHRNVDVVFRFAGANLTSISSWPISTGRLPNSAAQTGKDSPQEGDGFELSVPRQLRPPQRPLITSPAITFRDSSACASHRRLRPLRGNPPICAGPSSKLSQSPDGSSTTLSCPRNDAPVMLFWASTGSPAMQPRWICHGPGPRKSSRATAAKAASTRGSLTPSATSCARHKTSLSKNPSLKQISAIEVPSSPVI
jgi:hypothetical protein